MTDLHKQAARLGIHPPSIATLRRYGITADEWLDLLHAQGWICPICERRVPTWNTDHEHVPRWKHMPPEQRKRYVRGVLCARCNWKFVHSRLPAATVENIARYLRAYEARRDA